MNIIIAGGTGQIGSRLTQFLAAGGHEVTVLTRQPERQTTRVGVRYVQWDGKSLTGWTKHIDGADAVINLAGENIGDKPWTDERLAGIRSSRVDAGGALVEAIRQAGNRPGLLVQASAVGYYGTARSTALDENSPAGEDLLARICLDWEDSTRPVEDLGVRRVILRTGLVLEKERGILPRMLLPIKLFAGGPIGSGKQVLSWIHLQDELAAIKFLVEDTSTSGAFNLTSPHPATNREFGKALAKVVRRPFWLPLPAFAMKLLLGRQSELVLEGQQVLPARLLNLGFTFNYPNLDDALDQLLT